MATEGIRGAGAYPADLVPAVRPGDKVELLPSGDVWEVASFSPQPGVKILDGSAGDSITVSDGDFETVEATPLEAQDEELLQLRPLALADDLPEDVRVTVDFGGEQAPYYQTKNARGAIRNDTGVTLGYDEDADAVFPADQVQTQLVEFYVYEQEVPFFTFQNNTGGQVTISNIMFSGYRYDLVEPSSPSRGMGDDTVPIPTERHNL